MRISVLRAKGMTRRQIAALRPTVRVAQPVETSGLMAAITEIRATIAGIKTPNGTTKKIARILDAAVA